MSHGSNLDRIQALTGPLFRFYLDTELEHNILLVRIGV